MDSQHYSSYVTELFVERPLDLSENGLWSARVPTGHLPSLTRAPPNSRIQSRSTLDFLERLAQAEANDAKAAAAAKTPPGKRVSKQHETSPSSIMASAPGPAPAGPATSVATLELILRKTHLDDRLGLVIESEAPAMQRPLTYQDRHGITHPVKGAEPRFVPRQQNLVTVGGVGFRSIADAAGFEPGDRFISINGIPVPGSAIATTALLKAAKVGNVVVAVERTTKLDLGPRPSITTNARLQLEAPQLPLTFNNEDGLCLSCQRRCMGTCRKAAEMQSEEDGASSVNVRISKVRVRRDVIVSCDDCVMDNAVM